MAEGEKIRRVVRSVLESTRSVFRLSQTFLQDQSAYDFTVIVEKEMITDLTEKIAGEIAKELSLPEIPEITDAILRDTIQAIEGSQFRADEADEYVFEQMLRKRRPPTHHIAERAKLEFIASPGGSGEGEGQDIVPGVPEEL